MSVIFGLCFAEDSVDTAASLHRMAAATRRYGRDGGFFHVQNLVGLGFQAFNTHARSGEEIQPAVDSLENVVVFDGRLDNRRELESMLDLEIDALADSAITLKAFERWAEGAFSHFVGDWAMALWSHSERTLYLARDHAGSRNLFYKAHGGKVRWSTYLESFFVDEATPTPSSEYVALVLSSQDLGDWTPYSGVRSVLAGHYVVLTGGAASCKPHWDWIAGSTLNYSSDSEYDEHFVSLFEQSVKRRITGSGILAQLSGGMDSTSIVCMADRIVGTELDSRERIDTVSYYDEGEPSWDERPFFSLVERQRGKSGIHFDCSLHQRIFAPLILDGRFYPYPGADQTSLEMAMEFEERVGARGYRVILSGVGGDELLGGVPTAMPELADLLRAGHLSAFIERASVWSASTRWPLRETLYQTLRFTFDMYTRQRRRLESGPPWLRPEFAKTHLRTMPWEDVGRGRLLTRPSAISNGRTWWRLLGSLPHMAPSILGSYEYRYPYLDRDLVEFLHRLPRTQLAAPGRRRLLMRRALRGIVPDEIIERRRKAFISRGLIVELREARPQIETLFSKPLSADCGFIDREIFLSTLERELRGGPIWVKSLMTTIQLELWLRSLKEFGSVAPTNHIC